MAVQLRAAFDIGSGQTKMVIARVTGNCVAELLYSEATDVLLGTDFNKNKTGKLSQEIICELFATLTRYKEKADAFNAPCSGVATEVFRRASNGADLLKKFSEMGINVQIISQTLEGRLGFLTACASANTEPARTISWDSGGSSFQIVTEIEGKLVVYEGPIGSSIAGKLLIEDVQKKSLLTVASPNPVSKEESEQLVALIQSIIPNTPDWLKEKLQDEKNQVVAFGGNTNCFRMVSIIEKKQALTLTDVQSAFQKVQNKSDDELSFLPLNEPVVGKVATVLAVMTKHNIPKFNYYDANGNCLAILVCQEFW